MIYNLLSGLQINDYLLPTNGQTIIIELHKHNELEFNWSLASSVRILMLNETRPDVIWSGAPADPYLLKIPACADKDICTVKQFLAAIADLAISPEEWADECKLDGAQFSIGTLHLKMSVRDLSARMYRLRVSLRLRASLCISLILSKFDISNTIVFETL